MAEAAINLAMLNGGLRFAAIERQVFHVCVILKQMRLLGACSRALPVFMSHGRGVVSGVVKHEDVSHARARQRTTRAAAARGD